MDVAIAGAGFSGLWTAYYLLQARPDLVVAVVEKEFAGYGASGRNGGWLSAEPPGNMGRYAARRGVDATLQLQQEMFRTVDEVISVAQSRGIDASIRKDGLLYFATNDAQMNRLKERVASSTTWGWTEDDITLLDAPQLRDRVNVPSGIGGLYTHHAARIDPARFVRGLAEAVEALGGTVYEDTTVTAFAPHALVTDRGRIRAKNVIVTLEGYLSRMPGYGRRMLPMNSSMIITEPLTDEAWETLGWRGAETLGDAAHSFTYMHRTDDRRIALGGRGVPYNFRSSFDWDGRTNERAVAQLIERLHSIFPATATTPVAHTWTGVLGVPRDWSGSVSFDRATGIGMAGGYVGHGVSATNLAGRTLADFVLGQDTQLTRLGWIDRTPRKWEPEPIRWLGASTLYRVYGAADGLEARSSSGNTSLLAKAATAVAGR
ncbi:NAD(P)/FAD-dependent oxidoreductase [Kocuria nitroreducens]|uniref:NAD(P)/FAD-dependent oxidoreductase n=1 Tax=Kocuria nitroreducens TaxID=3058914 RepID=UPI0036D873F8